MLLVDRLQNAPFFAGLACEAYLLFPSEPALPTKAAAKTLKLRATRLAQAVASARNTKARRHAAAALEQLALFLLERSQRSFTLQEISDSNTAAVLAPFFATPSAKNSSLEDLRLIEVLVPLEAEANQAEGSALRKELRETVIEEVATPSLLQ